MSEVQRLQKILAQWGVASRRQAETLILAGRIQLNGQVVRELGTKADPLQDCISLDGRVINPHQQAPERQVLLLHKPRGVLSTCRDPQGRSTVLDLLPPSLRQQTRFFPVGRLDADTSGALLLTNDGDLTLKLTHPRFHLNKTYRVEVEGIPSGKTLQHWQSGVDLEDGRTLPAQVERILQKYSGQGTTTVLSVVLQEGRNRQIRRVAAALGHPVVALHREAIGALTLGDLLLGQFRSLSQAEVLTLSGDLQASHVCPTRSHASILTSL